MRRDPSAALVACYQAGDTVRLYFGGPRMRVLNYLPGQHGEPMVACEWHCSGRREHGWFRAGLLEAVAGALPPSAHAAGS